MLETVAGGGTPERPAPTAGRQAYYEEYQRLGLPAEAPILEPGSVPE